MDALRDRLTSALEGKIDFEGQKLVDSASRIFLIAATIISFLVGFALQSLQATFVLFGSLSALLLVIVLPPWPMFNQHPVTWLPAKDKESKKTQ